MSVAVYRSPVAGEGAGDVFIGNAVRLDDARPDIEAVFPNSPFHYRTGWGYLMLTNFLPNGGDGAYLLKVFATDREGNRTLIGMRSIVGQNSTATRPFGAIDTPDQGESVSGTVANFGWVLVRTPYLASPGATSFATVSVVIDGVGVGTPSGWTSRSDLTALFPQSTYPGVNKALGVFSFDSTVYANGVHTLAWGVTADNAQSDGIGSRYFTIVNGSGALTLAHASSEGFEAPAARDAGRDLADERPMWRLWTCSQSSRRGRATVTIAQSGSSCRMQPGVACCSAVRSSASLSTPQPLAPRATRPTRSWAVSSSLCRLVRRSTRGAGSCTGSRAWVTPVIMILRS